MVTSVSSVAELSRAVRAGARVKFLFFWGHHPQRDGSIGAECLSQWWPAPFTLDGQRFATAEHHMMWRKATLFGDHATATKILTMAHPQAAKTLGRQVTGFVSWQLDVDEIWRSPFTDLHVIVDEWDQGWGRGNQELATMVRQLCRDHLSRVPTSPGIDLTSLAHGSAEQQTAGLRRLLNAWDFIGVHDPRTNVDEYDCLIAPLLTRLTNGAGAADLSEYLTAEIRGHFGMTVSDTETRAFARRLLTWWGTEQRAQ